MFFHSCQDSELTELKDTIDILKAKNTEAQEIIQGALSSPDVAPRGEEQAAGRACMRTPFKSSNSFNVFLLSFFLALEEVLLNRENSSESIDSLASTASHACMASLKEQEAKMKKKKKSWVSSLAARVHRGEETGAWRLDGKRRFPFQKFTTSLEDCCEDF